MKFITLYNEWMKEGKLPKKGLCVSLPNSLLDSKQFHLCSPTTDEVLINWNEGGSLIRWGIQDKFKEEKEDFTALRQNIMLLCACMREEY